MTNPESPVVIARLDALTETVSEVKASVGKVDDRQRKIQASLTRLEERTAHASPAAPPAVTRGQVVAGSGIVAVMLALVEVIRALALG